MLSKEFELVDEINNLLLTNKNGNILIYPKIKTKNGIHLPIKISQKSLKKIEKIATIITQKIELSYFNDLVKIKEDNNIKYAKKNILGKIIENNLLVCENYVSIQNDMFPDINNYDYITMKSIKIFKINNLNYIDMVTINDNICIKLKQIPFLDDNNNFYNEINFIINEFC